MKTKHTLLRLSLLGLLLLSGCLYDRDAKSMRWSKDQETKPPGGDAWRMHDLVDPASHR